MFLGLVRQRPKHVCSASIDYRDKTRKKKNAKKRKSWNLLVLGSFQFFLLFQKSSRFVYPAVVLRFSQKHTCLEQSESFFGLFDLSLYNDHVFLGSGGSTFQTAKKCQTFFADSCGSARSDESRPCACSQHVQNCLHGKDLTLSGSNKWLKTLVIEAYDCCAASAQAVHKTSSCFFHVGQISHQHFSHQCSDLLIHSLKASQLGDDVIEDVFPDMVPWTYAVQGPNKKKVTEKQIRKKVRIQPKWGFLSFSEDAPHVTTCRDLIFLPTSSAMSKELQPSYSEEHRGISWNVHVSSIP